MPDMEPPWARHPEIIGGSIGWRMGVGEEYAGRWRDFVVRELGSLDALLDLLRRHPKAPWPWRWYYLPFVVEDLGADDPRGWIESHDVVGVDVAWSVWVRNCERDGRGVPAPWDLGPRPGSSIERCVNFGTRRFSFCCRWIDQQRQAGRLDAAFARWSNPPADQAWVADTIRGLPPRDDEQSNPWRRIAADLLRRAEPRAPWESGVAPPADGRFGFHEDDGEAFATWQTYTIEDTPSLDAYIARHPGITDAWSAVVNRWRDELNR